MRRVFGALLLAFSVFALIAAILMFNQSVGGFELNERYGGDAYTGIQNAAAQTANNVRNLNIIVSEGFGYLLLLCSLVLFACGLYQVIRKDTPVRIVAQECNLPYAAPVAPAATYAPTAPVAPAVPVSHTDAVHKWTCFCGRENADYVSTCVCGITKAETKQYTPPAPAPKPVHTPTGWLCSCGREHRPFETSCICGVSKKDIR